MTDGGCGAGHTGMADELRDYATGALDLLEPWLDRIRERPADPADPEPASCAVCPVCALITVLRGDRSELAVRVAEQAAGLLAVLRAALAEGDPAGSGPRSPGADLGGASVGDRRSGPMSRSVRRIPVHRDDGSPASEPC